MSSLESQLFRWVTEEMSFLPFKESGNDRVPVNCNDLKFMFQGPGEEVWTHVMKHVHSREKVDKIRKIILLNRARDPKNIQKRDPVGNKLDAMCKLRDLKAAIKKEKQIIKEKETQCKEIDHSLKVAECQRLYHLGRSKDIERRISLLTMADETAEAKAQLCNSSEKFYERYKSDSNVFFNSSPKLDLIDSFSELEIDPVAQCTTKNGRSQSEIESSCLDFINKCSSLSKEVIEERLLGLPEESSLQKLCIPAEYSIITQDSNYFSRVEQTILKHDSQKFDSKKKEIRQYISENAAQFPPQILQDALVQQMMVRIAELVKPSSEGYGDGQIGVSNFKNGNHTELKNEIDGRIKMLNLEIVKMFMCATKEKLTSAKARKTLTSLMGKVEEQLKEMFSVQVGMIEKAHYFVKLDALMSFLTNINASRKKFIHEMEGKSSSENLNTRLRRITQLIKAHKDEEARQRRIFDSLKHLRGEIEQSVMSNHCEFRVCMDDMKSSMFLQDLKYFKMQNGLAGQEVMAFSDYPLEYHQRTNVCGNTVPEFKLLINNLCWQMLDSRGAGNVNEDSFSLPIQATMGHLPHCSSEAVLFAAINSKAMCHPTDEIMLQKLSVEDVVLQSTLSKIPGYISKLRVLEDKWKNEVSVYAKERIEWKSEIKTMLDDADFILKAWMEGAVGKHVPSHVLFNGKNYQQWLMEMLGAFSKKKS